MKSTNAVYADGRQTRLLPLARIPDRSPPFRCDDKSRHRRADGGGAEGAWRQPDRIAQYRAGCGARQRRPRTSRRLFHGQHGDAQHRRARLWHPLRQRALPADHSRRLAAGRRPRTGSSTAIRGSSSGRNTITRSASAASVEMVQGDDERTRHIWHPAETVEAVAYDTPIVGWRGKHVNTLRLWSARAPGSVQARRLQRRPTTSARFPTRCGPRRSPRCSIQATPRPRARNCA